MKVEIDGVLYVPATEAVPDVDDIMQALYETYMGPGRSWRDDNLALWIGGVNEDGEGDTFPEFLARISEIRGRKRGNAGPDA